MKEEFDMILVGNGRRFVEFDSLWRVGVCERRVEYALIG